MIKAIAIFIVTLVSIISLQVFIMGGWDNQTIGSKYISTFIGVVMGLLLAGMHFDEKN